MDTENNTIYTEKDKIYDNNNWSKKHKQVEEEVKEGKIEEADTY